MQIIILIILLLYVLLILQYTFGWYKIKKTDYDRFTPKVSVVISLRNEAEQVETLLRNLRTQLYPTEKIEFILVNDHSTDNTFELLQENTIDNLVIINLQEVWGKKQAISKAISVARGDIILTTDADCSFGPNWAQIIVSYFADEKIELVSGPVTYLQQDSVFHNLQVLEFTSLIASGAGAIASGNPIFCNGANMAFRKKVFLDLNDFANNTTASGDDVFLLHSVKRKYPHATTFAKDEEAVVRTSGTQSIKEFISQRKRWTAKSSAYKDIATIYVSFIVLLTNLTLLYLFAVSFINISTLQIFGLFYLTKFVVDVLLLYPVLKFFNRNDLVKWVFPFELLYSFYIVLIVILSFTKSFSWKGRIHKK
ncbi:MAG: glycosyltransferase [Bacteroidota bacterium]|nr:glycosyltransferase [Bacteroidota bacterium]